MFGAVRAGDLYHPSYGAPPALCKMGTSFVLDIISLVDADVPAAGFETTIWTTPSEPYMLEHAMIALTGPASASQVPPITTLELKLNGSGLVVGNMSPWTSTKYELTSQNLAMWMQRSGLGLLDSLVGTGTAAFGAMTVDWTFAALTAGSPETQGF